MAEFVSMISFIYLDFASEPGPGEVKLCIISFKPIFSNLIGWIWLIPVIELDWGPGRSAGDIVDGRYCLKIIMGRHIREEHNSGMLMGIAL